MKSLAAIRTLVMRLHDVNDDLIALCPFIRRWDAESGVRVVVVSNRARTSDDNSCRLPINHPLLLCIDNLRWFYLQFTSGVLFQALSGVEDAVDPMIQAERMKKDGGA